MDSGLNWWHAILFAFFVDFWGGRFLAALLRGVSRNWELISEFFQQTKEGTCVLCLIRFSCRRLLCMLLDLPPKIKAAWKGPPRHNVSYLYKLNSEPHSLPWETVWQELGCWPVVSLQPCDNLPLLAEVKAMTLHTSFVL